MPSCRFVELFVDMSWHTAIDGNEETDSHAATVMSLDLIPFGTRCRDG